MEEIKRLLETAQRQRNSARWAIALALGLQRGTGLRWPDIDQMAWALTARRSRLRVYHADRPTTEPPHRSPRVETAAGPPRRGRASVTRRAAHRRQLGPGLMTLATEMVRS